MNQSNENKIVHADEHGVLRVGSTRVRLDSIVAGFHCGCSPESIQQQYPAASLGEVYGAIAYYLSHTQEVDAYLENQSEVWRSAKAESASHESSAIQRLRALAREKADSKS